MLSDETNNQMDMQFLRDLIKLVYRCLQVQLSTYALSFICLEKYTSFSQLFYENDKNKLIFQLEFCLCFLRSKSKTVTI